MNNLIENCENYVNMETAPFIILGVAFILIILKIRGSVKNGFGKERIVSIVEAMDQLDLDLKDINLKYVKQDQINVIAVYFDYLPSSDILSMIPLFYKGFEVQTKIYDDLSSVRIK